MVTADGFWGYLENLSSNIHGHPWSTHPSTRRTIAAALPALPMDELATLVIICLPVRMASNNSSGRNALRCSASLCLQK